MILNNDLLDRFRLKFFRKTPLMPPPILVFEFYRRNVVCICTGLKPEKAAAQGANSVAGRKHRF